MKIFKRLQLVKEMITHGLLTRLCEFQELL